jgi:hypothetical protein
MPEELGGLFVYLVFKSLSIVDECPMNGNVLDPKGGAQKDKITVF